MTFVMPGDWMILTWIQTHCRGPGMDTLVSFYSSLGNGAKLWVVIAVVCLLSRKYRRMGCYLIVGLVLGWFLGNAIFKPLIARPRPCWLDPSMALLIPVPQDYSFPSGHTLSSTISATVLWCSGNRLLGGAGVVLATLMALSRLYLYVHFPSDILGGVVLGVLIGVLVSYFCYKEEQNINY